MRCTRIAQLARHPRNHRNQSIVFANTVMARTGQHWICSSGTIIVTRLGTNENVAKPETVVWLEHY